MPLQVQAGGADVVGVKVLHMKKAGPNIYRFRVTVRHDDTGWDHYADRWEVLGPDGTVLGIRVLHHPHENEQPFTRYHDIEIPPGVRPYVILMVGVNGAGKTTTIGKLARRFKDQGLSVMLAAGDTFRAAAVEQLEAWGKRNDVAVVSQQPGADPAAVIFDAWEAASARDIDVLLADTAGRLQNQQGLMDELAKIKRVIARRDETAPQEIMLVLDASQGQNALVQAEKFHDALGLTGITVTKLDGSAKGGILLAIANQLRVPVRFIGIGETAEDMQPFAAAEFVDALLATEPS